MKIKNIFSGIILSFLFSMFIISCSKSDSGGGGVTPGGGGGTGGGGSTATGDIGMAASTFSPGNYTAKVGTAVKWYNNDNVAHTVTSNDGSTFSSGNIPVGGTFTFTPTAAGTFLYHCNFHAGMTGTLVVTN